MTDSREGLALLAGEVVVVALALLLVATSNRVDPVALGGESVPAAVLGAGLVVVGAALGALRTAETVDGRAAIGELGLGGAVAAAISFGTNPQVIAIATGVAVASVGLRIDGDRVSAVLDR